LGSNSRTVGFKPRRLAHAGAVAAVQDHALEHDDRAAGDIAALFPPRAELLERIALDQREGVGERMKRQAAAADLTARGSPCLGGLPDPDRASLITVFALTFVLTAALLGRCALGVPSRAFSLCDPFPNPRTFPPDVR
jgi:hypothetical protein